MHILITGGTGLVGGRLVPALIGQGHTVTLLTRTPKTSSALGSSYLVWDGKTIPAIATEVNAVINLAGAGVADQRWTATYKQRILQSRTAATKACVQFIQEAATKPAVFISASAVGYYGSSLDQRVFTETDGPGTDFLGHVGKAWEAAAAGAGVRTVLTRIGVVLAHEGGAFPKLLTPFKLYAGGPIGSGKQGLPWIHIHDLVAGFLLVLNNHAATGPVNLVAPDRHGNASFGHVLGKVMGKPSGMPVPEFAIKLLLGESAVIVTQGQYVSADKLLGLGLQFAYPTAEAAVSELLTHH
jgi:uncharacterized protein